MRRRNFRLSAIFRQRRTARYYPRPKRLRWAVRLFERQQNHAALAARVALTFIVVAHLTAVLLFPRGQNDLFDTAAPLPFSYLTLLPVEGTLGFYKTAGKDGFLVYKIYTEQGGLVEGAFPDQQATPRLRYDRLAMLAHHMSEDNPPFHYLFLSYLVDRLPGTPLKLELHSAKWAWEGATPRVNANGGKNSGILVLRNLGSYDGLRKSWTPANQKGKK